MAWAAVIGAGGALAGGLIASKGAKDAARAQADSGKLDPRIEAMLFGKDGQQGLLDRYKGMLDTPQSAAGQNFGTANSNYINSNAGADLDAARYAAYTAMGGKSAPQAGISAYAVGSDVQAPGQNNLNLSGSFNSLINGAPGSNSYLTGAIQKGINQSSNAFGNMMTDAKSATQDLLGNIRGGSIAAGQFGGSRQALAEGKAIDSFNTNMSRAASQFGQNNTDAAVAAQAGAYDADRNRQLAATQGLSGQQYGVAQQNAQTKNAAEFMNVGNTQQTNLANLGAQLQTNGQNNSSSLAGAGLLSGLLGGASTAVNAQDNWGLSRAQGVNSLLAPFMANTPTQQPVSSNSGAAALGGGLAGLSFGNSLAGLFGGPSGATSLRTTGSAGNLLTNPGTLSMPGSLSSIFNFG
ncbi:hypothetical protein [Massilia sp. DD77]|uniref:hypothetical protein n=1 Tax=Massilia sp. DD77 TaxID=3109349 RepID=UPI0030007756